MPKIDLKKIRKNIVFNVTKFSPLAFMIFAIVLFGIMFLNIRQIAQPKVSPKRLEEKLSEVQDKKIKLDEDTINEVQRRSVQGPDTTPTNTGDPNPFD